MAVNKREEHKAEIQKILTRHVGRRRAIGAAALARDVFGAEAKDNPAKIKRLLRALISELRQEGAAIASHSDSAGGGYYLMVGSEREEFADKLKQAGLRKLVMAARILDTTLDSLLENMLENLKGGRA